MWTTGETPLPAETRPHVADASPLRHQRPLYLLPNRDRQLAPQQLGLPLEISIERAIESTRFLVACKSTATNHLQRTKGRANRSPFVPTAIARMKSNHARRQSSCGGSAQSPHVPIASHDERP
jgi:hypothetical protein